MQIMKEFLTISKSEIEQEQQCIDEAEKLIKELDEKVRGQEEEQYGTELGLRRIVKSC